MGKFENPKLFYLSIENKCSKSGAFPMTERILSYLKIIGLKELGIRLADTAHAAVTFSEISHIK